VLSTTVSLARMACVVEWTRKMSPAAVAGVRLSPGAAGRSPNGGIAPGGGVQVATGWPVGIPGEDPVKPRGSGTDRYRRLAFVGAR
jgi:hypothetical protein